MSVGIGRLVGRAREHLDEALPVARSRRRARRARRSRRWRRSCRAARAAPSRGRAGARARGAMRSSPSRGRAGDRSRCSRASGGRRGALRVVGRERRAALEHLGDRREVLVALGLLLERVERAGRRRLLVEHALVERHRLRRPCRGARRRAWPSPSTARAARRPRRRRVGLLREQVEERLVGAPLGVELLEPVDRLAIARARRRAASRTPRRRSARSRTARASAARSRATARPSRPAPPRARPGAPASSSRSRQRCERLVDPRELAHARQVRRVELHDLREHRDQRRVALHVRRGRRRAMSRRTASRPAASSGGELARAPGAAGRSARSSSPSAR